MTESSVTELFPSAVSPAYAYDNGYLKADTLRNGAGYWVKFDAHEVIPFTGPAFSTDTLEVQPGWNLVGSLSHALPVDSIQSVPEGIVTTEFIGFQEGYAAASVLAPGRGYWVKVNQTGRLILSKGP